MSRCSCAGRITASDEASAALREGQEAKGGAAPSGRVNPRSIGGPARSVSSGLQVFIF